VDWTLMRLSDLTKLAVAVADVAHHIITQSNVRTRSPKVAGFGKSRVATPHGRE